MIALTNMSLLAVKSNRLAPTKLGKRLQGPGVAPARYAQPRSTRQSSMPTLDILYTLGSRFAFRKRRKDESWLRDSSEFGGRRCYRYYTTAGRSHTAAD